MSDWFRKLVTKAIRVNGVELPNQPALNIVAGAGVGIAAESLNVAAENSPHRGETRVTLTADIEGLATALAEDETVLAAVAGTVGGFVDSGTYTPDVDSLLNCTLTGISARWMRSGDVVLVLVECTVQSTANGLKRVRVTLPPGLPPAGGTFSGSVPKGGGTVNTSPASVVSAGSQNGTALVTLSFTEENNEDTRRFAAWFSYEVDSAELPSPSPLPGLSTATAVFSADNPLAFDDSQDTEVLEVEFEHVAGKKTQLHFGAAVGANSNAPGTYQIKFWLDEIGTLIGPLPFVYDNKPSGSTNTRNHTAGTLPVEGALGGPQLTPGTHKIIMTIREVDSSTGQLFLFEGATDGTFMTVVEG